ncbi:WxL domain-containing protein [Vagococcus zengguangii]|uniref:WxL domain-containing protein n=1 Tax=Vagococcus zengguangii TaxID=2571750 RepID=A0A4D7CSF9_9ENTE|nr:WxL domain-containing protein [Vagococcus zengguangii]QCI85466.1 WxL domain-containing protein [Vagococcus zengguangii]TLG80011.1 WxL domain-containing protein [Vagococcus zengguangii]
MKKNLTLTLAATLLGATALPMIQLAETTPDGGEYVSNGVIEFTPNTDPTDPVDPTDPTDPVDPVDPTDPEGPTEGTNGPLSIDYASSFYFGENKITSKDQTYYALPQTYHKTDKDGKVTEHVGPNYVQVTDNRGTETGWSLQVTQDDQFKTAKDQYLTGAILTLENGVVVSKSESKFPTGYETITLKGTGEAEDVMTATDGAGAGTYLLTWGTDADSGAKSVSLFVPGSTTKYAATYHTKLTWSLTDVPKG